MSDVNYQKLQNAFLKALDVSINSIGESDLQDCFGDLKNQFGGNLQMAFVNMISKTEKKIENRFQDISEKHNVERYLQSSSIAPEGSAEVSDITKTALDTQKAIRKAEIEEMNHAIHILDAEIKRSNDGVSRLRTQLYNEIEALNEQSMKLERVTEHCL